MAPFSLKVDLSLDRLRNSWAIQKHRGPIPDLNSLVDYSSLPNKGQSTNIYINVQEGQISEKHLHPGVF